MEKGNAEIRNFIDLLKDKKIIVPIIQRDYAQGRSKGSNKILCEEVRKNFIKTLCDFLSKPLSCKDTLLLDYIYGTTENDVFYPIDGQQRLTTLFLLHWYIGKKEKINEINKNEFDILRKFSYEIRDTSKEFCESLIDIDVNFNKDKISEQIKDSPKYHYTYNFDPTILSMLVVLDSIHNQFKGTETALWDRLNNIEFWCLSLEKFGLTDDLFVKMNARGKRLSRFDVFKSDLESNFEKIKPKDSDEWIKEIDNDYLDAFWNEFKADYSEINLFRTILFYVKGIILIKNENTKYDDSWEIDESNINYYDVIEQIKSDNNTLSNICHLLSNFECWKDSIADTGLFIKSDNSNDNKTKNILGFNKVKIFGILYWFSFDYEMKYDNNFKDFKRILENYIFSLRQPNITQKKRFYSSSIDNSNVGKSFSFLKNLIDGYDKSLPFNEYVLNSNFKELNYEREKLRYKPLEDIISLEEVSFLKKNIMNFYFDDCLYIKSNVVEAIAKDEDLVNKSLRIIYSYAQDKYGEFLDLLMDKTLINSGFKRLYYNDENDTAVGRMHKLSLNIYGDDDDSFGDRILTASGIDIYDDISHCVKEYVKELSKKINLDNMSINDAVNILLKERIENSNFKNDSNVKWYIVKYEEFFYNKTSTTLSVLRRKNYGGTDDDNVYDMQCVDDNNDFWKEHYHPFYLALSNRLKNNVKITSNLRYTGVDIEYKNPCMLSNGWKIQINGKGNWDIYFGNNKPSQSLHNNLTIDESGKGYLNCSGFDSIEIMADFLNSL